MQYAVIICVQVLGGYMFSNTLGTKERNRWIIQECVYFEPKKATYFMIPTI